MKKRMISLVLVVAMLLCAVPAASAAENDPAPAFYSYYLSLSESIAIKFKFANSNENCYVTFNDGTEKFPVKNGIVTYADMSPAELAKDVKVTLYNGDTEITSKTVSALGYCKAILNGNSYSANMKNLAADLINFGIAFRASKDNASEYKEISKPENFDAYASVAVPAMEQCTSDSTFAAGTISGGVALEDAVMLYVECAGAEKIVFTKEGGASVTVEPEITAKGRRFYFRGLNPAEMRKKVTVKGLDASGNEIGTLTTTIEDYAADCNAADASAELAAYAGVTKAMMQYGDAVAGYVAASASDVLAYYNFNYTGACLDMINTDNGYAPSINAAGQYQINVESTSANYVKIAVAKGESKKVSVEWDYKITWTDANKACAAGFNFVTDGGYALQVDACKGQFRTGDAWSSAGRCSMEAGRTYHVRVEFNFDDNTFDLYVDNTRVCDNRPLKKTSNYISYILIDIKENTSNTETVVCFDNVIVRELP